MEGLSDRSGKILHLPDQEVMFGAGSCDSGYVDFLEGIIANQGCWDLPGKNDYGN
jgi:hypothetical protein